MERDVLVGLITGLASGVLTAILLWIATSVWVTKFIPWYEERLYKGISLQGTWTLVPKRDDGNVWGHEELLDIRQVAHRISGTVALTPAAAKSKRAALVLAGEVRDRFVMFTMQSPSGNKLSYSTYLLEIVGSGDTMRGACAFYSVREANIDCFKVEYRRGD